MENRENRSVSAFKTLSATDTGHSRTHQSGILIPKDARILRLFPRLNPTAVNPDANMHIRVPRLGVFRPARFVFYNTKDLGIGTRSEYRLTQIARLLRELGAVPGDQLKLSRDNAGDLSLDVGAEDASIVVPDVDKLVLRGGWTIAVD
ncbi:EcoRII N-terminal effector-binding domain-containing protein [Phycicoccus sonneratiae]|uniref:Restriction endonuclease type II EcoRII N-terminal domain-containing protein n=1 Tax=Phycicoccus sonneratiae TaxID=2807628 RepID=A0ABS2CK67_9MICO|nr:hypothetical protein [Phycicoccus sonneraticus]